MNCHFALDLNDKNFYKKILSEAMNNLEARNQGFTVLKKYILDFDDIDKKKREKLREIFSFIQIKLIIKHAIDLSNSTNNSFAFLARENEVKNAKKIYSFLKSVCAKYETDRIKRHLNYYLNKK